MSAFSHPSKINCHSISGSGEKLISVDKIKAQTMNSIKILLRKNGHKVPYCFDKMFGRLGEKEIFLLVNRPKVFLSMINCKSSTYHIEVAVHEAVHMMDLNLNMDEALKLSEKKLNEIPKYQFRSKTDVLKLNDLGLPRPYDMVNSFVERSFPELLEEKDSGFVSFYKDYITDKTTASSLSFEYGFSTELNAYVHGTIIEDRLKRKNRKSLKHDPLDKVLGQRQGGIFFLSLHHVYLSELKKNNPKEFKKLLDDKILKNSLRSNINRMVDALLISHRNYPLGKGEFSESELNVIEAYKKLRNDDVIKSFIKKEKINRLNEVINKL